MRKSKWLLAIIGVLVVGTLLTSGTVYAGPAKEPVDKMVFVHYPKHAPGEPAKAGAAFSNGGVLAANYKYSGIHWANPSGIPYYINPADSGVDSNSVTTAINATFATWDNADGPLGYICMGTTTVSGGVLDGMNVVSWANISSQYPNAIAVTTVWYYRYSRTIAEVDTQMNSALGWSYTAPNITPPDLSGKAVADASRYIDPSNLGVAGTYDIRDIMTHEAGHWIMLGDLYSSRDSELTMYGYGSMQELKKDTLGYGDELGVERVYPY